VRIAKAHGLGNDFLLAREKDCPADPAAWARRLCDRHVGVGADGVLVYGVTGGVVRMRLLNADGSEAEISGNGLRCLGAYAFRGGQAPARHVILTAAGPKSVGVRSKGGSRFEVETDLGPPILASREIPVALDPHVERVVEHPLEAAGRRVSVTATSLGNPHCAVFLDAPAEDALLETLGPSLERHAFFPRRTNVEFVHVARPDELRVRFWERGVGRTSSSGTGAASALVAAVIAGRSARTARVVCDGGVLEVEWPEGGSVRQTGEVEILFEGEWLAG
jgi:diaminopimelate epimerase